MPKFTKSEAAAVPGASDVNLLAWLATCVSVFAFLFYYRTGEVLLYGDAIAHINIARRVFDSRTPGVLQLGTVWLPLPHLLMIPFILSTKMWQTGAGGSIPSMAGYVFAVIGIFRLTRSALTDNQPDRYARFAAWTGAIVFGANPNLIYMQSTAMGGRVFYRVDPRFELSHQMRAVHRGSLPVSLRRMVLERSDDDCGDCDLVSPAPGKFLHR